MNMISLISMDILVIIALCITISMAKRHVVDKRMNMGYRVACVTTIILLMLEMETILAGLSNNQELAIPNRIFNVLGFSLSPVVPFILVKCNYHKEIKRLYQRFLDIPLCFNALICILSYKTGWIFFVNSQNQYIRGNLFLLPTLVSSFYYVLIIKATIENDNEYESGDRKAITSIMLVPILTVILQILFKDLILIWSSVALSLLLYYAFLRELQFTYDIQTGVKNRTAFEREMEQCVSEHKNAGFFMFDLNNLKETNDVYGHKAGDEMIFDTAKTIKECFMGIGRTYRIGGDEFCVICEEIPRQLAERRLANLDDLLIQVNQNRQNKIVLACGCAFYNPKEGKSIYAVFSQADEAMYAHKAKLKGLYGRRSSDQHNNTITTNL